MVGIIFAMEEELLALKKYMKLNKEYNIFELKFYEGKINGVDVVLVESGIGKVNAARTTQILIDNIKVDYIFNIGVAGGVDNNLDVLDIVIATSLVQHDFDITAFNHKKGYIPNIGDDIKTDSKLVDMAINSFNVDGSKIFKGVIASGDIFCTDSLMTNKINKKFGALCVEMEGASIAQVCYLSKIPFLIIRSISDVLGKDNLITYEEFLYKSSDVVALFVRNLLLNFKVNILKINDDLRKE